MYNFMLGSVNQRNQVRTTGCRMMETNIKTYFINEIGRRLFTDEESIGKIHRNIFLPTLCVSKLGLLY
jgi:hypothetical protein